MKNYGIIDIGSNSVRARVFSDGKIIYGDMRTTRLGEGLATGRVLTRDSISRTVRALVDLKTACMENGADEVLAFATEAVRSADNGEEFTSEAFKATELVVDVVSGDEEGELGLLGAVGELNGGIIDIGGASAEISAVANGKIIYSHSLPLGAVRLYGTCGEDAVKLEKLVSERLPEYGDVPKNILYRALGGTATTLAAMDIGLEKYDADKVDGYVMGYVSVERAYSLLRALNRREREDILHIPEKRSDIIVCGAYMLKRIMETFGIERVIVSESDNMLGYYKKRVYGVAYER